MFFEIDKKVLFLFLSILFVINNYNLWTSLNMISVPNSTVSLSKLNMIQELSNIDIKNIL